MLIKSVTFKANIIPSFDEMKPIFLTHNEELIKSIVSFINEWENDLDFFIAKTSGSTGIPKEIKIQKKHAIQSSLNTAEALSLQKKDKALLCLNPDTIGGKMMIIRSLVLDLQLYVSDINSNPFEKLDEEFDFVALVPLQLHTILLNSAEKLSTIKNTIVGGGIISSELEQLLFKYKSTVYQTFGMTETISHIALRRIGFNGSENYQVLPNISISVNNNQLEVNAPTIGVNHLLTTDCVEIIDETHFKWLGRTDFVVNSGGIKIHPEEVESQLSTLIDVPFFVTGIDDEKFGQKLIIVIQDSQSTIYSEKSFYTSLPLYHIPKEVWFIDTFEWTKSNKINRKQTLLNNNATGIQQIS